MNDPYSTNHRLSLNIRITLGRISRTAAMKEEEKEKEEETEDEKEDQAARITHQPTKRFTRSLRRFLSVAPGYFIDDLRRRKKSALLSTLLRTRVGG